MIITHNSARFDAGQASVHNDTFGWMLRQCKFAGLVDHPEEVRGVIDLVGEVEDAPVVRALEEELLQGWSQVLGLNRKDSSLPAWRIPSSTSELLPTKVAGPLHPGEVWPSGGQSC
eukprot:796335-Amphidinium_carterae.1